MGERAQHHRRAFGALSFCSDAPCSLCYTRKMLAVLHARKGGKGLARYGARIVNAVMCGDRDASADLWSYLFRSVEWEEVAFRTVGGFRRFVNGMHVECTNNHRPCAGTGAGTGAGEAFLPPFE
jgi:hypothetical protein